MYINFEMTFFLYSENQEQWMKSLEKIGSSLSWETVFRVLGPDLIIENALKNLEKWSKNQENIYIKKGMVLTIVMIFYGFV